MKRGNTLTLEEFRREVLAGRRPSAGTRVVSTVGRVASAPASPRPIGANRSPPAVSKAAGGSTSIVSSFAQLDAALEYEAEAEERRAYLAELRRMGVEPW